MYVKQFSITVFVIASHLLPSIVKLQLLVSAIYRLYFLSVSQLISLILFDKNCSIFGQLLISLFFGLLPILIFFGPANLGEQFMQLFTGIASALLSFYP